MAERKEAPARKAEAKATKVEVQVEAPPEPKLTKAEVEAKEVLAEAKKEADAKIGPAYDKAVKANANLAKDGSGIRVEPEVRDGEVRYKWGYFVPTQFLTDEEVEALEGMK
jgi:hypothetical protein